MVISSSVPLVTHPSEEHTELEKTSSVNLMNGTSEVARSTIGLNTENEDESIILEQAASKAQAAVRGYLARRTFLSLTGIILLQAQIRSHLARKQFQPQVCAPNLEGNLVISTKTKESKQSLRKISISMAVASEQGPPQPQPASKPNSEPEPELPMNVESNWKENLKTSGATKQSKTSDLNYTTFLDTCVGFDLNDDEIKENPKKKASSVGLTGYNTYLEKMAEEVHVFNSNFNVYMEYKKDKLRKKEKTLEEKQRTEDLKKYRMS
ncbi:protein IQ-DOMAIN 24 [Lactuca sativa]|nr:protein IQ-DOMAIN 24 [Lactuca sativa]XP_023744155.1 protein IQ-DOMAIN 24 [Lactuca sativa]XP_042756257.1 protein IQ-DOMAIN 24 [Lactuca sativa]